jgi:hypothetical protein
MVRQRVRKLFPTLGVLLYVTLTWSAVACGMRR